MEGPLLTNHDAAEQVALVEAGPLVDVLQGQVEPLDALALARGELYGLLVSSRHWRWAAGQRADRAMSATREAYERSLNPRADVAPTRAGLDALLIAIAHQIQEQVPPGAGTDEDVDRLTHLWRWSLTPFLRPFYVREHPSATAADARGPFDSLVHDLIKLAFRELGHARIPAPPIAGRQIEAWLRDAERRKSALSSLGMDGAASLHAR